MSQPPHQFDLLWVAGRGEEGGREKEDRIKTNNGQTDCLTVICLCIFISRGRGPPCKSDTCFCIAEHQRASHHIRLTLSTFVLVFTSHEGRLRNVWRNSPRLSSVRGFGSTLVTPPSEHNLYLASLRNGVMASLTIKPLSSAAAGDKLIGSSLNIQPQSGLLYVEYWV